jgi:2-hydroxyglutaryl-CoA dehydratase, D-component
MAACLTEPRSLTSSIAAILDGGNYEHSEFPRAGARKEEERRLLIVFSMEDCRQFLLTSELLTDLRVYSILIVDNITMQGLRIRDQFEASIGIVGSDVPYELVRAAGLRPIRLKGNPNRPTARADRLLGRRVDPQIRSIAEWLLERDHDGMRGLLISHDNHSHLRLFGMLRAVRALDPSALPPLHFCDLLHSSQAACVTYTRARLLELRDLLSQWSGNAISESSLRSQIAAANAQRATLRSLAALRRQTPPTLTGSQTLALLNAAWRDEGLNLPIARPDHRSTYRVFLTGSSHDNACAYEAIEAGGCVIVGEDHDWGDAGIDLDLDEQQDPFAAFSSRLALAPPASAKSSITARAAYVVCAALNAGADAVIAFIREGDAGPRWDIPDQRRALEAGGLPLLLIDDQPYPSESAAAITETVKSFLLMRTL